jgi:hypothetical protein
MIRQTWILLVHQLPAEPAALRVRTWRRLQRLGAVAIKNSVYALPHSPEAREDFEWLRREIVAAGGRASVFQVSAIDARSSDDLRKALQRSRVRARRRTAPETRPQLDVGAFQCRRWFTRPRPGVDRMAAAWLIRTFIDRRAVFAFADVRPAGRAKLVTFDMFEGDFTHEGDRCTFEVLCLRFGLTDPRLAILAALVHDLDLKDERYGRSDAPLLGSIVAGLREQHPHDGELLEQGMAMFDALYRGLKTS